MMTFQKQVTVIFCSTSATLLVRQSKSTEAREIGRRFAPLWEVLAQNYKKFSLNKTPKANSSFQPLMFGHKSSTYTIAETEPENLFLGLLHLDTNKNSRSLLLVFANFILLMMCCVILFVKQAIRLRISRPLCDGCPFASSLFCRLAGRGLFFLCGVLLWWLLQVAFYLCRRQSTRDHVPRCGDITETQRSRPYGTTTCYLHTAILLGKSQSMLTQVEHSSEPDLVCHRISPFSSTTCCPAGPMSLERLSTQPGSPGTHRCMKMQTVIVLGVLFVVLHINVDDVKPCSRPKCSGGSWPGTRVSTFRLEACDASHGIREGFLVQLPPLNSPEKRGI